MTITGLPLITLLVGKIIIISIYQCKRLTFDNAITVMTLLL